MLSTSAAAIIAAVAFWWVIWPTRTIHEFTTLLEQGRFDEANQFLKPPARLRIKLIGTTEMLAVEGSTSVTHFSNPVFSPELFRSYCTIENLETESRSITDMLLGQQAFSFHRQFTTPIFIGGYAERGSVVLRCEPWAAH